MQIFSFNRSECSEYSGNILLAIQISVISNSQTFLLIFRQFSNVTFVVNIFANLPYVTVTPSEKLWKIICQFPSNIFDFFLCWYPCPSGIREFFSVSQGSKFLSAKQILSSVYGPGNFSNVADLPIFSFSFRKYFARYSNTLSILSQKQFSVYFLLPFT